MYTISSDVLDLFQQYANQIVRITVSPTTGSSFTLANEDIMAESLSIDRYSTTGDKIEIGSAIAGQVKFRIANPTGAYNSKVFEGAQLYVQIGVAYNNSVTYIPFGYYTVDNQPRKSSIISIVALDRMVKFDKYVNWTNITFPKTIANLISACCSACGITCATSLNTLPNYNYSIPARPEGSDITYRQLIQWAAQLTGMIAYMDRSGQLRFGFYGTAGSGTFGVTTGNSYSQTIDEGDITITGVALQTAEANYLAGTDAYAIQIISNPLAQSNYATLVSNIYNTIGGYTYRPFTATTRPIPHLDPLDAIKVTGEDGATHNAMITHITFTADASTSVSASGRTAERNGYASLGAMSARQTEILQRMKKDIESEISDRDTALITLNEMMANSLGLYVTAVPQVGGGNKYYYHDAATLAASSIIYTFNSNGFAWTDDWNDGDPTWNYGIDRNGNAVINMLSAYKISTDLLDAGCVTAEKIAQAYKTTVTNEIDASAAVVTQNFQTADGLLQSQITSNTNDISSIGGRMTTAETNITQNANAIALKASQTDLDTLSGRVTTDEGLISVQSNKIALVVTRVNDTDVVNTASIVTAINNDSSVTISADRVNLSGYVTITSLGSGGTTQIDGSRITTGTIAAARIDTDNLVAKNLLVKNGNTVLMQTTSNSLTIGGFSVSGSTLVGEYTDYPGDPSMQHYKITLDATNDPSVTVLWEQYNLGLLYASKQVELADGELKIEINDMAIRATAIPILSVKSENSDGTFNGTVYVDLANDQIFVRHL